MAEPAPPPAADAATTTTMLVSMYRLKVDVEPVTTGGLTSALFDLIGRTGLHCGSGATLYHGWLNTDICTLIGANGVKTRPGHLVRVTGRWYYQHDLPRPYPIAEGVVPRVFSEHLLEHLKRPAALAWMKDVRRMLVPGGIVRLSTPDLALYIAGYLDPEQRFIRQRLGTLKEMRSTVMGTTRGWVVNQLFRYWGHEWIYDLEAIVDLAVAAGFPAEAVRRVGFREGADPEMAALDKEIRRDESIYVEITKPPLDEVRKP